MIKYPPEPWKTKDDKQCGKIIIAANGYRVYAWPQYISYEADAVFSDDPCKQFGLDGTCLDESAIDHIVACVNFCRNLPSDFLERYTAGPPVAGPMLCLHPHG